MKIIHGQEISIFRCGLCPSSFSEETEYQAHFNEIHRLKIRCKICCVGFKLQEELDAHITEKHPPAQEVDKEADSSDPARTVNPLNTIEGGTVKPVGISLVHCPVCGMYFSNGELYKGHINKYHQQLMVTCKFCNEVIFSPEVSHHIAVTHTTCFSCLESFASEELLQAHIMECMAPASQVSSVTVPVQPNDPAPTDIPEPAPAPEPQQPVTGPTPQASGSDQPPAPVSKSPGRASRPYACEYCEKRFSKVVSLHMHKSQSHKDKIDPSLLNTTAHCDLCDRDFASYIDLEQHNEDAHKTPASDAATPTPTRPTHHYYCPFIPCDFYGYTEEDVHRHQRARHWYDFVYRCNKCKFVSDTVDSLGMHHAKVHLGPFVDIGKSVIIPCNLCQYNAKGWEQFFVHIRTHLQNKYPCSECQWTFCSSHALNKHAVSTHDTRHFGCGFCILDFPSNDALCTHTQTHQITCHFCWELFMSDEAFNKHMERKHPTRQLTIQQSRTAEEERAWEEQQKQKAIRQLKRQILRDREEDRKRRLHGDTPAEPAEPTPSMSSGSPRKKRRRKQHDPADLPDDDDNGEDPPDDDKLDPDFQPEEEEEDDDDDDDNGGNDD